MRSVEALVEPRPQARQFDLRNIAFPALEEGLRIQKIASTSAAKTNRVQTPERSWQPDATAGVEQFRLPARRAVPTYANRPAAAVRQ